MRNRIKIATSDELTIQPVISSRSNFEHQSMMLDLVRGHLTPKLQPAGIQQQSQDSIQQAVSSRIETIELQTYSSLEVKPSLTDGETVGTIET